MSAVPPARWRGRILGGVVLAVAVVGGAVLVLARSGGAPVGAPTPAVTATPAVAPSATPAPSPVTPAPPTSSPPAGTTLVDLDALIPRRVAGFRLDRSRPAPQLAAAAGADEARRLRYTNTTGAVVTHMVSAFEDRRSAGRALRARRDALLAKRGYRVVDDTGLEDSEGVRRGRLIEVRTRNGAVVVLWRNRTMVAVLGAGRQRLNRRLYAAWPY